MGIENNPQSVDDLNEAWPAKGEPAKEGYRHFQNIKKVVKARANAAGAYGVTTLTSALDDNSENIAATAKSSKDLKDLLDGFQTTVDDLEQVLEDLDTSVGEAAVPVNGLWTVAPGDQVAYHWRHPQTTAVIFEEPGPDIFYNLGPTYYIWWERQSWFRLLSFVPFNAGEFRLKFTAAFFKFNNDGRIDIRVLRNGAQVFLAEETKSSILAKVGNNGEGSYEYSVNLDCQPGDVFLMEIRFVGTSSIAQDSFTLTEFILGTAGKPLLVNAALPASAAYRYITSGNQGPDLGYERSYS